MKKWYRHEIPDTEISPLPVFGACAASIENDVYFFAGRLPVVTEDNLINALWKLTRVNRSFQWTQIQFSNKRTMPSPRKNACAWEYDGKFWAFGGCGPFPGEYLNVGCEMVTSCKE